MSTAQLGLLGDRRVQLIDGEILEMAPQNNPHMAAVTRVVRQLMGIFDERDFWVRM